MADISYKDLIAPPFYGLWNDVVNRKYPEIWLAGGRGCVDGDTLISTPSGSVRIRDFKGGVVYAYDDARRKIERAVADAAKCYSEENLYEVCTRGGKSILVTDEHRFLTPFGWKMTKELKRDDPIVDGGNYDGILVLDRVSSIQFKKRDHYWDVNVHGLHNYVAQGFVNHNSTKSSFVSTCIPLLMEMNPDLHCVCFRKFGTNLADSVYAQFEYTINEKLAPIANNWIFGKSPLKIKRVRENGRHQQILFRGLDDPQKVKSLKAPFGYFGLIWFEELAEFDSIQEVRNVLQSLRRGGHYFQTFCSYNPPETTACWVNSEAAKPQIVDGKLYRYVHHSDYRAVPREWLGDDFFVSAELLKQTNERAYRHEYLGEVTGNGGAVFPNVVPMAMSDELIATFDSRRFGLDFGFALDPLHYSASHYDKKHRDLYIFDEINELNCTNIALAELLKGKKEQIGFNYIMCDAAEPKSIAELEGLGVNCLAAQKGPDSRRFSYRFLQSLAHIYIDPKRCPVTYDAFVQCEYLKNKAGEFISRYPENGGDDPIDSVRYAIMEDAIDAGLF